MHLTRLPIPHLFMGLSAGIPVLLTVTAVSDVDGGAIALSAAFPWLLTAKVRTGSRGHGRPLLGLGAGLLTGFAGASSLAGLGLLNTGSPQWIYLPLAFATLGTVLSLSAGVQRSVGGASGLGQPSEVFARPYLKMIS